MHQHSGTKWDPQQLRLEDQHTRQLYKLPGNPRGIFESHRNRCKANRKTVWQGMHLRKTTLQYPEQILHTTNSMAQKEPRRHRNTILRQNPADCKRQRPTNGIPNRRRFQPWNPPHCWQPTTSNHYSMESYRHTQLVQGPGPNQLPTRSRMAGHNNPPPTTSQTRLAHQSHAAEQRQQSSGGNFHRHTHTHIGKGTAKNAPHYWGANKTGTWWKHDRPAPQTQEDEAMDSAEQEGKEQADQQTAHERPPTTERASKKSKQDILKGHHKHECGGNGACGYNALAVASFIHRNPTAAKPTVQEAIVMGRTLRQQVKQHIDKHTADYEAAWAADDRWTVVTEGGQIPKTYEEWKNALLRDKRWICQHTLRAAANRLGLHVTVLIDNGDNSAVIQTRSSNERAPTVVLHLKDQRYTTVLKQADRDWPAERVSEADTLTTIPRGGANNREETLQQTPAKSTKDWLPNSTPRSTKAWLPSTTPRPKQDHQVNHWLPPETPRSKRGTNTHTNTTDKTALRSSKPAQWKQSGCHHPPQPRAAARSGSAKLRQNFLQSSMTTSSNRRRNHLAAFLSSNRQSSAATPGSGHAPTAA